MTMTAAFRDHRIWFAGGFILGLGIRVVGLWAQPTMDMAQYLAWGSATLDSGLAEAFRGIYFPVQYQLFAFAVWWSRIFSLEPALALKLLSLAVDIGMVFLLRAAAVRWKINPLVSLWYWLHPWFLSIFSLGYVDAQFTFCILLSLFLLDRSSSGKGLLLAGIPFGVAFLMKPQALALAAATVILLFLEIRRRRQWLLLVFLTGPAVLFVLYALGLAATSGGSTVHPLLTLPYHYATVSHVMPVLSANMPNVWYVVGALLLEPGQTSVLGAVVQKSDLLLFSALGAVLSLGLISALAWRVVRVDALRFSGKVFLIWVTASFVVPFLMTQAHENHLFLASVLFLPLFLLTTRPVVTVSVHLLLLLQWMNLTLLYGADPLSVALASWYSLGARAAVAVASSACGVFLYLELFRISRHPLPWMAHPS